VILLAGMPLAAAQHTQKDLFTIAAQNEQQRSCSDDDSIRSLLDWLRILPRESALALPDPVVREAAINLGQSDTPGALRAAAQRIFLQEMDSPREIDNIGLDIEMVRLRLENRHPIFLSSVSRALEGDDIGSILYRNSAVSDANRKSLPDGTCSRLFRSYLARYDERIAYVAVSLGSYGPSPFLYQNIIGVEKGTVHILPKGGCDPKPAGSDFLRLLPDGRAAGQYSSLGFPEVVQLSLQSTQQSTPWICSGVLLADRWALTAAHCMDDGTRRADDKLTLVYLNARVAQRRTVLNLPARSNVIPPAHLPQAYLDELKAGSKPQDKGKTDIALLELATPLGESANAPSRDAVGLPTLILGTLAGYGATLVKAVPDAGDPALGVGWIRLTSNDQLLTWSASVAAGANGAQANASCPNDSGAPIYATLRSENRNLNDLLAETQSPSETIDAEKPAVGCIGERRQLIGLVSYGESVRQRSCLASSTGAGPRLLPHLPWICKVAGLYCQE